MSAAELPLPTDTALVKIQSRQYRLLNIDLGEGIPRTTLKVGACAFLPWFVVCYMIGVPLPSATLAWLLPPTLATWAAMSEDEGGRLRIVGWIDWLCWATRRHAPIVNAGTAPPAAPRPVATPIAFLVDATPSFYEDALILLDPAIRPDFTTPPGDGGGRLDRMLPTPEQETTRAHAA